MKAGSLVECIKDIPAPPPFIRCNKPIPKKGDIETVESINELGGLVLVGFEFEALPPAIQICEIGFDPGFWRELQPPMDISFITELQLEEV